MQILKTREIHFMTYLDTKSQITGDHTFPPMCLHTCSLAKHERGWENSRQ